MEQLNFIDNKTQTLSLEELELTYNITILHYKL